MDRIVKEHAHFTIGFNESRKMEKQSAPKRSKIGTERSHYRLVRIQAPLDIVNQAGRLGGEKKRKHRAVLLYIHY